MCLVRRPDERWLSAPIREMRVMFPLYDLNPHRRIPWLTLLVIAANLTVTVLMAGMGDNRTRDLVYEYGFVPARVSHVSSGQPVTLKVPDVDRQGRVVAVGLVQLSTDPADVYPTFFTTMFLHGGWGHLLMNMWILWIFGNNVEDRLGHLLYACYYLIGGLAATLCHYATDPNSDLPVIGASGAVATVLGGYAITYPWAKVRTLIIVGLIFVVDIPALVWLGIWFVLQMIPGVLSLQGIVQQQVAYWAHIGGFVAGMALMPLLSLGAPPPGSDWRQEADDMFQYNDPRARMP
ncbi:MAG: rhomboid family intramembrane serine protease [Pirellulales bacterium]